MSLCPTCNCETCCCGEEMPYMQLSTYPPIQDPGAGDESQCPDWRFYDTLLFEFTVPAAEESSSVTVHVCDSEEYFPGMYVSIFDRTTYVGLFRVVSITGTQTIRIENTGVDANQAAGYVAAAGAYVIVAQPPEFIGQIDPDNIPNESIQDYHLADCAVRERHICADQVNHEAIQDNAIESNNILDGTIQPGDLGFAPVLIEAKTDYQFFGDSPLTPIPAGTGVTISSLLKVTYNDCQVGDWFLVYGVLNGFSPNVSLVCGKVGTGTASLEEHKQLVRSNDTSESDLTPVNPIAAFKVTAQGDGQVEFGLQTASTGNTGYMGTGYITAIRFRAQPAA